MIITEASMRTFCHELHAAMAERVFGDAGVDALFAVFETVSELYKHVEPLRVRGHIIVFCLVPGAVPPPELGAGEVFGELDMLGPRAVAGIILGIRPDGTRHVYTAGLSTPTVLARVAVVYEFREHQEQFFAGAESRKMPRLIAGAESQFAVPTFFTLSEALRKYAAANVRYSGCPVLNQVWADPNRLFLKPGPEEEMRRSLTLFLKACLSASYEVRPEQVMDESHPVDIKVTYTPAKRLMIIEIKWLGRPRYDDGTLGNAHTDARAKAGATQLAGYLDQNQSQAPLHVSQGYYVIIDARRRGLRENSTTISREDGLYYANRDVEFDPAYHQIREDYDPPYRMFAEPIYVS